MQELVKYIVDQLVDDPNCVDVSVNEEARVINILVDKSEIGRIIGKQGRIIKAVRAVAKAGASKNHKRYSVEIDER